MRSLFILPPEVIFYILSFLSPRDVVRLRVISKQLHDLSYDRTLWETLYRNAHLPRPPGPFLSQSFQFFEHSLVQSERLADTWTTQPMEAVSAMGIRRRGYRSIIVEGKWLITFDEPRKMLAYDLDSDSMSQPRQLLWESRSDIHSWDACTVFSASGLLIHVVFNIHKFFYVGPWTLLEFRMDGNTNTFHHTLTLSVPARDRDHPVFICGGHSPFSYIVSQRLIFNTETRLFYEFPRFTSALTRAPSDSDSSDPVTWVTLTNTHIISLSYHATHTVSPTARSALFQAFIIPGDSLQVTNGTGVLRLTHEGAIPIPFQYYMDLIRNSIVNSLTGVTSIRFLHQYFEGDSLHFSCIDLTLPSHTSPDAVLPITINSHDITVVNDVPLNLTPDYQIIFSDDGYVRGLWNFGVPGNGSGPGDSLANALIMRFTIDASRDKCVAVLGRISVPLWEQLERPILIYPFLLDLVRGMICFPGNVEDGGEDDDELAVVTYIK